MKLTAEFESLEEMSKFCVEMAQRDRLYGEAFTRAVVDQHGGHVHGEEAQGAAAPAAAHAAPRADEPARQAAVAAGGRPDDRRRDTREPAAAVAAGGAPARGKPAVDDATAAACTTLRKLVIAVSQAGVHGVEDVLDAVLDLQKRKVVKLLGVIDEADLPDRVRTAHEQAGLP